MDKLIAVIGQAPSEIPISMLIKRLDIERSRVSRILSRPQVKGRKASAKRAPKPKTTVSDAQLRMIAEATGVPIEDLRRG